MNVEPFVNVKALEYILNYEVGVVSLQKSCSMFANEVVINLRLS